MPITLEQLHHVRGKEASIFFRDADGIIQKIGMTGIVQIVQSISPDPLVVSDRFGMYAQITDLSKADMRTIGGSVDFYVDIGYCTEHQLPS